MKYIDLNTITTDHVLGKWEVKDRFINSESETNVFSDVRLIELQSDSYTSVNGKQLTGKWSVIRENTIIYNPQIKFFIDGKQVGNAIITRLFYQVEKESNVYKLTLYFNTGLELILQRNAA